MASRRLQSYATPDITVTFDPTRCIHAAECVRSRPRPIPRRFAWSSAARCTFAALCESPSKVVKS